MESGGGGSPPEPITSSSSLRQDFITTANSLAALYRSACNAESNARAAGARESYMHILEWAAIRSRRGEAIDAKELLEYCSAKLAEIPVARVEEQVSLSGEKGNSPSKVSQRSEAALSAGVRSLFVGRKRPRLELGESMMEVVREENNRGNDPFTGSFSNIGEREYARALSGMWEALAKDKSAKKAARDFFEKQRKR